MSSMILLPFSEIYKHTQGVDLKLLQLLDELNKFSGNKVFIHRMLDTGAKPTSQHYFGRAADLHIRGLHVIDQYLMAERFNFGGLGIYPRDVWTKTPGIHVDVRETEIGRRWGYIRGQDGNLVMVGITRDFFERVIGMDSK